MLLGNFARCLALVQCEAEESEYIAARPFRVNAGPVGRPCRAPKTAYMIPARYCRLTQPSTRDPAALSCALPTRTARLHVSASCHELLGTGNNTVHGLRVWLRRRCTPTWRPPGAPRATSPSCAAGTRCSSQMLRCGRAPRAGGSVNQSSRTIAVDGSSRATWRCHVPLCARGGGEASARGHGEWCFP
jgi:hypothetical protein